MEVPPAETLLTVSLSGALEKGGRWGVSGYQDQPPTHIHLQEKGSTLEDGCREKESLPSGLHLCPTPLEATVKSLQVGTAAGLGVKGKFLTAEQL